LAVVQESLLIRMGLSIGDRLKIGHAMFLITGIVRTEPDRMANAFILGPRVNDCSGRITGSGADQAWKPGARTVSRKDTFRYALEPLFFELRDRLATDSARVSSYRTAQSQLRQFSRPNSPAISG